MAPVFHTDMALHREGKYLRNELGAVMYLRGGNVLGHWHDSASGAWCTNGYNTEEVEQLLTNFKAHGMNFLREMTNAETWILNPVVNSNVPNLRVRDMYKDFINRAGNHGIYVMLMDYTVKPSPDSDPDICGYNGYAKSFTEADASAESGVMPTRNDFVNYVVGRVAELGAYENFVPEFWNEPYWQADVTAKEWQTTWQLIINGLRNNGYTGAIAISSHSYGMGTWGDPTAPYRNLNWYYQNAYPLTDPLNNYIIDCHIYRRYKCLQKPDGTDAYTIEDLKSIYEGVYHMYEISREIPIMISEFGVTEGTINDVQETEAFKNGVLIFNEWGIHYASWCFGFGTGGWSWMLQTGTRLQDLVLKPNGQVYITALSGGTPPPPPPQGQHVFDHWELDGVNVGSLNPVNVLMNTSHTLTAVFSPKLTISATVGGTTNPAPATYAITQNAYLLVTALPDTNHRFSHWNLDGANVGNTNPYIMLMDKPHTLEAVFEYVSPPPLAATLQGYVKDKGDTPIPGATVTCDGYADITEIDGAYAFVNIPAKQYSLNFTKEGYESPQPIIIDASLGGTFNTDVVMNIISPAPSTSKLSLAIPTVSLSTIIGIAYLATRR